MLQSLLQCGRLDEEGAAYIFNFNPTQKPEDDVCRIIRPQKFYDVSAISVARAQASGYRSLGYCPLHRHPELVEFIESLCVLYGGALVKCLSVVDLEAAKVVANSPRWMNSTKPHCTMLDHTYRTLILEPAINIVNGMRRESFEGLINQEFRYIECKGRPPVPLLPSNFFTD
jgi:hypothetical protein